MDCPGSTRGKQRHPEKPGEIRFGFVSHKPVRYADFSVRNGGFSLGVEHYMFYDGASGLCMGAV